MMNRSHLGRKKNRNRTPPPRRLVWAHSCDRSIDGWMDGSWWTASACCDTVPWNHDGRLSRRGCNGSSSRNRCPRKWIDRYAPAYWNLPSLSLLSSRPFSPFLSLSFSRFSLVPSSRGHQVRMHATRMHAFWRSIPSVESAWACMRVCASAWILLRGWEMDEEAAIVLGCVISMRYFFARMGEWIHRNSICSFF